MATRRRGISKWALLPARRFARTMARLTEDTRQGRRVRRHHIDSYTRNNTAKMKRRDRLARLRRKRR